MKMHYGRGNIDWRMQDWTSIQGTRLYAMVCEHLPNLERMLGKGPESFTEEEWNLLVPVLRTLDIMMLCNEEVPFDRMHLSEQGVTDGEALEIWLTKVMLGGVIGESERYALEMQMRECLGIWE